MLARAAKGDRSGRGGLSIPSHLFPAQRLPSLLPTRPPGGIIPTQMPPNAMDFSQQPIGATRLHLERCWQLICDIDPMILRLRLLRKRGSLPLILCLEQELLPLV